MEKISVIIISKNEERMIEDCLKSLLWTDEIILIDAESEDNTVGIAKKYTDNIFKNKWKGFANQKEFALSKAKNEWVLNIDADERVSLGLQNEIKNLDFYSEGYFIPRENYFLNRKITTCGWSNDFQLRLFRKSKTKITEKLVHEGFVVEGKTDYLKSKIIHYSFVSIEKGLKKINLYSNLQAAENYKVKKKVTAVTLITHTFSAFFRPFISLNGYKDGIYGLIISFFNSVTTLLTYVKIWELQNKK
jgi:glycosyltransferase involved in cell wall biosynthesis